MLRDEAATSCGRAILIARMLLDLLVHRFFLTPLYEASTELWRLFNQMNVALIYSVTLVLNSVFVGIYGLLVRPKSLGTGIALEAFVGLALGVSAGLGTFIHMPIPPAVAWGWFVDGWLKAPIAGALVRTVIVES